MPKTFAEILCELRERKGLSMEMLAHRCEVAHSTISRYESGRFHPRWRIVQALARALGVSTQTLRDEVET